MEHEPFGYIPRLSLPFIGGLSDVVFLSAGRCTFIGFRGPVGLARLTDEFSVGIRGVP